MMKRERFPKSELFPVWEVNCDKRRTFVLNIMGNIKATIFVDGKIVEFGYFLTSDISALEIHEFKTFLAHIMNDEIIFGRMNIVGSLEKRFSISFSAYRK